MEYTESNIKAKRGYLIVERHPDQPRVLYADDGASAFSGLSKEELLATSPKETVEKLRDETIPLDDSHELWILDSAYSQQKRISELEQMLASLGNALKAAKEANQAKSSFLSNMSHDIRTPMNAILGMTSIGLSHIDEKPRVQDCLLKIQTASTHLMSLVNDVLDMSRIDSGRLTLNEEPFSLAELVHDIAVILRPQAIQKGHTLKIEIGQIYEEGLVGDSLHLRQILVNIIGNAVKYTQNNGKIYVRFSQHTEVSLPDADNGPESKKVWLEFLCEDNGMGMSPVFLERIFVPFERVRNEATSKIEGTGLGMAIVKNLVDCMGGQIKVESKEGVGSRFFVELPFTVSSQSRSKAVAGQGQTVLIAGYREHMSQQTADYLKDEAFIPVCVKSGQEAVTFLTEAQYENHMPCAILLLQDLEDMPVLELASHVRQLAGENFPILLISEQDWAPVEYRATRSGVNAFVPCPLFKSKLMETLYSLTAGNINQESGLITDYSNCHLLLVEDNELNQEIAVELLSSTGIQVEAAGDGARAVEIFAASPENYFDLILMDIQMPVMNGYEATRKIRQLKRADAQTVWIVAMTANAFVEDIRLSQEAGMNDHVSKPVDPELLLEILRSRLGSVQN